MTTIQKDTEGTAANSLSGNNDEVVKTTEIVGQVSTNATPRSWSLRVAGGELSQFLTSPVKILDTVWSSSAFGLQKTDPWQVLMSDTNIRNKMTGYSRLYVDGIVIRLACSGTPFHLGALQASYEPNIVGTATNSNAIGSMIARSQLQSYCLDPSKNSVVEFDIPYINVYPYIDLMDPLGSRLGVFWLEEMNALEMINNATPTSISVIATAFFVNPHLEVPTSTALATYTAQ